MTQGVRLYVEALSAVLAVASVLAILAVVRSPGRASALALGAVVGLGVLAKQSGLVLLAVLGVALVLAVLRRAWPHARAFAFALGVAAVLAAPFWIRNWVYFGSPVYPVLGRDLEPNLLHLNMVGFTPGPQRFFSDVMRDAGPAVALAVLAALAIAAWRRRGARDALLWGGALLLGVAPLMPMLDARHVIPLVSALIVLAADGLAAELASSGLASRVAQGACAFAATIAMLAMPDPRAWLNPDPRLESAWAAIRERVPADGTVLCIETYDAFYYTGRNATWPIPWGQRDPPLDVLTASEPERIYSGLTRRRIDYVLMPVTYRSSVFNSANFPAPFVLGMGQLDRERRIEVLWTDQQIALIRLRRPGELTATP
jgi:hypothetical protein